MPGVAQKLEFIAMKTVALVREQMDQRDGGGNPQDNRRVHPRVFVHLLHAQLVSHCYGHARRRALSTPNRKFRFLAK
jgi:hypothetical protein